MIALALLAGLALGFTAVDGDSLRGPDGQEYRLWGLDAPEGRTVAGRAAARAMATMIDGRYVDCRPTGNNSYDRLVARCYVDGHDLAALMIAAGHGRPYCRFSGRAYDIAALVSGQRPCRRSAR